MKSAAYAVSGAEVADAASSAASESPAVRAACSGAAESAAVGVTGAVVAVVAAADDPVGLGVVLGSTEPLGDGPGDAVALDDVVGVGAGSASALVAGAPTSATATSRVPARRSSAPRAVVGVDIRASLSGS